MMEATEAELKTVTAATAAAGQKAIDMAASGEGAEAAAGEQQSLLEALLSRLEDAELISRKRLEHSVANKAKEAAEASASLEHPQPQQKEKKKLAEQDADGMWAWKSPVKLSLDGTAGGSTEGADIQTDTGRHTDTEGAAETFLQGAELEEISPVSTSARIYRSSGPLCLCLSLCVPSVCLCVTHICPAQVDRAGDNSSEEGSPTVDDIDLQIESVSTEPQPQRARARTHARTHIHTRARARTHNQVN